MTPNKLEYWKGQSESDLGEFYRSIMDEIDTLFTLDVSEDHTSNASLPPVEDMQIKDNLIANVAYIFELCARVDFFGRPDEEVRNFARDSLVKTRLMLSFIRHCVSNYEVDNSNQHNFFSITRLSREIAKGGHVVIKGGAPLFDVISNLEVSHYRFSSHYRELKIAEFLATHPGQDQQARDFFNSGTPDCSIQAPGIFNEFLFGKVGNDLWFQTEAHGHQSRAVYGSRCVQLINTILNLFRYSVEKLMHHIDYLKYVAGGRAFNIGPYGNSPFVESDPIHLLPR